MRCAPDCPNGGTVHFGAIPGEDMAQLLPIFERIGKLIVDRLDCKVVVQTGTSYTAVIEAMRAHRVDMASFGAFSYVLAHQVAGARGGGDLRRGRRHAGQLLRHHHHLARLRPHHAAAGQGQGVRVFRSGIDLGPPHSQPTAWSRPASTRRRTSRRSTPDRTRRASRRCATTRSRWAN